MQYLFRLTGSLFSKKLSDDGGYESDEVQLASNVSFSLYLFLFVVIMGRSCGGAEKSKSKYIDLTWRKKTNITSTEKLLFQNK